MPSTRLLIVGNQLKIQPGHSRLMLSDAACCCDGCNLWRRIVECEPGPTCAGGEPPPPREAWICDTVRCAQFPDEPLWHPLNRTILLDGVCWIVTNDVLPQYPPGSIHVEGTDPVDCVGLAACANERCPQGELWLEGRPCNPENPVVYFCGVTVCAIYRAQQGGCYLVDPSLGYVPLPPGALISNPQAGPFPDCCECEFGCRVCPLVEGAVDDLTCFPAGIFDQTCCRSPNACLRVTRMLGVQTFTPPVFSDGGFLHSITNEAISFSVDAGGVQRAIVRTTRVIDRGSGPQPEVTQNEYVTGGCGLCPTFSINPDRGPMEFTFTMGSSYTPECRDFGIPGLTVVQFTNQLSCASQSHRSEYRYERFQGAFTVTRFEFDAAIEDEDGGVCSGRCEGRGVSGAKRGSGGCRGCISGETERVI